MSKKSGFTLIELLIVVVIIGILASIAIPKFSASREKSFVSTLRTDLKNLATYQEMHHNGAFTYSASLSTLEMVPSSGVTITINEATGTGWAATAAHAGLVVDHCGIYQGDAAAAGGFSRSHWSAATTNKTVSRPSSLRTASAIPMCPLCTGSNVPPNTPTFLGRPASPLSKV